MPVEAGKRYAAKVAMCGLTEASQRGTPGVSLTFDCGQYGSIDHTVYIAQTAQALEITTETFVALGATVNEMKTRDFWAKIRAGQRFVGAECEIVTTEEEYNGEKRVRVRFVNAKKKQAKEGTEDYLATLFGAPSTSRTNGTPEPPDMSGYPEPGDEHAPPARRY